jgi:hypothetical protein
METQPNWYPYIAARVYADWCQKNSGHVPYVCDAQHEDGGWNCMFCAGGLTYCTRCSAFEGATPSECPGVSMSPEQADAVYACIIDYRFGQWCSAGTVFMLHAWVSPPELPPHLRWDWDEIERYIAAQEYEPRTVDAD